MFRFPKNQKLCNNTDIDELFDQGTSISLHPFRIVWFYNENIDDVLIKSLIVVPKKRIKLAVQRNTIKRYIRESYRTRKFKLEEHLKNQGTLKVGDYVLAVGEELSCFMYLN